jgi:hypothetical protein
MADKHVPIKYVGSSATWTDHLYGSGLTWKQNDFQIVPGYVALKLLKHTEFEDGRTGKMKGRPIDPSQPDPTKEEDEPQLVDLSAMTKENLVIYAKRNFNLDISGRTHKPEMIDIVRRQMGTDMPFGVY